MRRGTTLEGYLYNENNQQDYMSLEHQPGNSQLLQRWHKWVELECTKR